MSDQEVVVVRINGKVLETGGRVRSADDVDYGGLYGSISKIKMGPNDETDNEGYCVTVAFDIPIENSQAAKDLRELWHGVKLNEISLDSVIMSPDELTPIGN